MDEFELSATLVTMLREQGMKIASAESCTGGLIAKMITDVPGSSAVFDLGVVTYSNEMKTRMLGVPKATLAAHGAVSSQTARAMAEGVRRVSGADIGVSTTGVAGPDGGTEDKPVGLVYVGIATADSVKVLRLMIDGSGVNRDVVRHSAAKTVLQKAVEYLRQAREQREEE